MQGQQPGHTCVSGLRSMSVFADCDVTIDCAVLKNLVQLCTNSCTRYPVQVRLSGMHHKASLSTHAHSMFCLSLSDSLYAHTLPNPSLSLFYGYTFLCALLQHLCAS